MDSSFLACDRPRDEEQRELHSHLAAFAALESSLAVSRKALIALDLEGIRSSTARQAGLCRDIAALFNFDPASAEMSQQVDQTRRRTCIPCHPEAAEKLNQTAKRILDAARIQRGLLSRLQCKLRILARALHGPSVSYGPQAGGAHKLSPANETVL
jgi:hypothetical protein